MSVARGDVVLVYIPNVGATGGKVRPAIVVQSDQIKARLNETVVAAITSNTSRTSEAHQMLVDVSTAQGQLTGLLHDSAVRCERLHSIPQADVRRTIGRMDVASMQQIDACLKAALGIPQPVL